MRTTLRLALSVVCLSSATLFGCSFMTGDAPRAMVSTGQANGVNIKSSSSPYRVSSLSRLNKAPSGQRRWTVKQVEKKELEIAGDCSGNWCWSVYGVPAVLPSAGAGSDGGQMPRCATSPDDRFCQPLDWSHAFSRLRKLVGYMVDCFLRGMDSARTSTRARPNPSNWSSNDGGQFRQRVRPLPQQRHWWTR